MKKYFTSGGNPITLESTSNPFLKYYGNSYSISKSAGLLGDYIVLMITRFEQACTDVKEMIYKMGGYFYDKCVKRRKTIYALLNDLENLRKTMVRAQQIQKAQINRLGKENHDLRRNKLVRVSRGCTEVMFEDNSKIIIMIDKNMRAIADAKRDSAEITRCLAKNIISAKQNLEAQLDDFAMFSAMVKDRHEVTKSHELP
jgi:hypothetical protein